MNFRRCQRQLVCNEGWTCCGLLLRGQPCRFLQGPTCIGIISYHSSGSSGLAEAQNGVCRPSVRSQWTSTRAGSHPGSFKRLS